MVTFTTQAQYRKTDGVGENPQINNNLNWDRVDQGGGWASVVIETGHGGTAGQWYTFNSSGEAIKADASDPDKCRFLMMLTADKAQDLEGLFLKLGWFEITGWALTAGREYWLSDDGSGDMQTTPPVGSSVEVFLGYSQTTEVFHIQTQTAVEAAVSEAVEIDVYNDTGSDLTEGKSVYVSGYDATTELPEVTYAKSDAPGTMPAFGIVKETITTGNAGIVVAFGMLAGINTSAFTQGDILFVDAAVAGDLTEVEPAGNEIQVVAQVIKDDASDGRLKVMCVGRQEPTAGGGQVIWDLLVAPSGGDHTSLSAAASAASAGDIIAVRGAITEIANVSIPAGVQVTGFGATRNTTTADNAVVVTMANYTITCGAGSHVEGILFTYVPTGTGALWTVATNYVTVKACHFENIGTTVAGRFFQISGNYGIYDGLTFNGNGWMNRAFNLNGCSRSIFTNIIMQEMSCASDSQLKSTSSSECTFTNFIIEISAGTGTNPVVEEATEVVGVNGHIYTNFTIDGNDDASYGFFLLYETSNINGAHIEKCEKGIRCDAYSHVISNVTVFNCSEHGIYIQSVGADDFVQISNCTIEACGTSSAGEGGIHAASANNVKITGVHIYDTPVACRGINLGGAGNILTAVTVETEIYLSGADNRLTNCEAATIELTGNDGTVVNCECTTLITSGDRTRISVTAYTTHTDTGGFTKVDGTRKVGADPNNTHDIADGFVVGDHWLNTTTEALFACTDNTAANAVWQCLTFQGKTGAQKTISSGAIVLTGDENGYIEAEAESGTADTLDNITGVIGGILIIATYNNHDITITNGAGGGGQFFTKGGGNLVLTGYGAWAMFLGRSGEWFEMQYT